VETISEEVVHIFREVRSLLHYALLLFVFPVLGFFSGVIFYKILVRKKIASSNNLSARIIDEARKEAENIKKESILQAKDYLIKEKTECDREIKDRKTELDVLEKRIRSKEENLDKRMDVLVQKESNLEGREKGLVHKESQLSQKHNKLDDIINEHRKQLERVAGITSEEAKELLMQAMEAEAKRDAVALIRKAEEEAKRNSEKKANEIIAYAIQRYASDFVMENTVSVVNLPTDEMKGRIIGREGRNI
jgi:ribonuclease Y